MVYPVFHSVLCGLTSPLPSEDLGTKNLDLGSVVTHAQKACLLTPEVVVFCL